MGQNECVLEDSNDRETVRPCGVLGNEGETLIDQGSGLGIFHDEGQGFGVES